jgi:hypothetical protein
MMGNFTLCKYGSETAPQQPLCSDRASDLRRVIQYGLDKNEPVVYVSASIAEPECTGASWEIQQFTMMREGWICLAAIATDKAGTLGNTAVSRPLRLCFDDTGTPEQPSCMDLQNPPSCTDGCTLPRNFASLNDRFIVIE